MESCDLIGIVGKVKNRKLTFMLDTGASSNFISMDLIRTLGLSDFIAKNASEVRLANGKVISTCGLINLRVKFNNWKYVGPFYALECAVPLILGMQFCSTVKPRIDWGSRKVFITYIGRDIEL